VNCCVQRKSGFTKHEANEEIQPELAFLHVVAAESAIDGRPA